MVKVQLLPHHKHFSKDNRMYLAIISIWLATSVILWSDFAISLHLLDSVFSQLIAGLITFYISLGWLYGFYHIGLLTFTLLDHQSDLNYYHRSDDRSSTNSIAVLQTVCDDFQYKAAFTCVTQNYPDFHVYLLDDSSEVTIKKQVDNFCQEFKDRVSVIRRTTRRGYKAGNLNHALAQIPNHFKYIALVDSDTHLPPKFLRTTSMLLETNPSSTFVQTLHVANSNKQNNLAQDLGDIVRVGWNYYQPVRNKYGFPMCYGHGALVRLKDLKAVGGFPEIVSEDIGLTLKMRRLGFWGFFSAAVICGEDYPESYHTFRKRLSRWIPADWECFRKELLPFLFTKNVSLVEKIDALFRGLKVPLASMFLPLLAVMALMPLFYANWQYLFSWPTLFITMITALAPYFCFVLAMRSQPKHLLIFIAHLTTVYCSSILLFTVQIVKAFLSGKARFYVTGAKYNKIPINRLRQRIFTMDETGYPLLGIFELMIGLFLIGTGLYTTDLILIGISIALTLAPAIYTFGWHNRLISLLVYVPFILIISGLISSCFFGFGSKIECLELAGFAILIF